MLRLTLQPYARALRALQTACGFSATHAAAAQMQAGRGAASAAAPPGAAAAAQLLFSVAGAPEHELPGHLERPARVAAVLEALKIHPGLAAHTQRLAELPAAPPATLEEVGWVHTYGEDLQRMVKEDAPTAVADLEDPDGVTYITHSSFDDAMLAAGTAMQLVDAVVDSSAAAAQGAARSGAAAVGLTRPPGHHATADTPLGYCLYNNVALAARHAQRRHGLKKVLILDWDLHHGNGTCDIFYDDPSVLFVDTHEAASIYPPPFQGGAAEDVGEGAGRGATINIPLPRDTGHAGMLSVFDSVIAPAAERFQPDIMLISAGYDAHWRDPFQQLQFRSSTYHALAQRLHGLAQRLCGGRLVFLLEGGYHVDSVAEAVCETFLGLLGEESVEGAARLELPRPEPTAEVQRLVQQLRQLHAL